MSNLLKVNIEDIRMTLMTKLNRFHSDSIVNFEQMNPKWVSFVYDLRGKYQNQIDNVIDIIYYNQKLKIASNEKIVPYLLLISTHSLTHSLID